MPGVVVQNIWPSNLVQLMDYYPYGATRVATSSYPTNERRQYIDQFSDAQTGLDYLQARYYDSSRGQFVNEDPVFWGGPKQQNLADPQSLGAYSYSADNPITKRDPKGLQALGGLDDVAVATAPEWGPYVIPAIGAGLNVAGTYASNYLAHQPTSPFEVVTAVTTGAAFPALFGDTFAGLFASGFTTSLLQDLSANRKFNAGDDVVNGLANSATYGFFRWGAGMSPLEQAAEESIINPSSQTVLNNFRYQTALSTFQTSSGVVAQHAYSNSSVGNYVQQAQNYVTSAILKRRCKGWQ